MWKDYKLSPTYLEGRYLTVVKSSGVLAIAEIAFTFAEYRKPN